VAGWMGEPVGPLSPPLDQLQLLCRAEVTMDADEIRRMYEWIQGRIHLADATDGIAITFDQPNADDFEAIGFTPEAVELTLQSDWWSDMATDIIETPDYAEPGEGPEQVLEYARDVVKEYVAKRLYT
jgi:hypothetical protein